MKSALIFLIALGCSISTFAQDNWRLIYENDGEGNTVTGELADLISAVQNGETIRIYFKMHRPKNPEIYVEHTALVKFTTIMNSPNGQFVSGQIDAIGGQVPDFENDQVQLKENLEWSLIASTTGKNDAMTRNIVTGEIVDHQIRKWGTRWFVERK